MGRLTRDPEKKEGGVPLAKFTVAVDRQQVKEGGKEADFISCVAFGKTADHVCKFFFKGKPVGITGRLQTSSYEKDGRTLYSTDVVVDRVFFIPGDKTERAAAPKATDYDDLADIPF